MTVATDGRRARNRGPRRHRYGRSLRLFSLAEWIAIAVAVLLAPGPSARSDSVDFLVAQFDEVAFDDDAGNPIGDRIHKWTGPPRLLLFGIAAKQWRPVITGYGTTLAEVTGLDIGIYQDGDPSRLIVHVRFVPRARLDEASRAYGRPVNVNSVADDANCVSGIGFGRDGVIRKAFVIAASDIGPEMAASCLLRELVHVMGFADHAEPTPPSVMSVEERPETVSLIDRIMLRALYDPRLRAGMSRTEALPIARAIIGELVTEAATRAD